MSGRKGPKSPEHRRKLSEHLCRLNKSRKGLPVWNSGKKGLQVSPWKGKSLPKETCAKLSFVRKSRGIGKGLKRPDFGKLISFLHSQGRYDKSLLAMRRADRHQTFPERLVRARLQAAKVNFIFQERLPGSSHIYDFVLPKNKVVIEVDGCYHHGCPTHTNELLSRSLVFRWIKNSSQAFHAIGQGYRVIRLWQHDVEAPKRVQDAGRSGIDAISLLQGSQLKRIKKFFV